MWEQHATPFFNYRRSIHLDLEDFPYESKAIFMIGEK
jgi:hypothetical protein